MRYLASYPIYRVVFDLVLKAMPLPIMNIHFIICRASQISNSIWITWSWLLFHSLLLF